MISKNIKEIAFKNIIFRYLFNPCWREFVTRTKTMSDEYKIQISESSTGRLFCQFCHYLARKSKDT